jgi:hypothetical protein
MRCQKDNGAQHNVKEKRRMPLGHRDPERGTTSARSSPVRICDDGFFSRRPSAGCCRPAPQDIRPKGLKETNHLYFFACSDYCLPSSDLYRMKLLSLLFLKVGIFVSIPILTFAADKGSIFEGTLGLQTSIFAVDDSILLAGRPFTADYSEGLKYMPGDVFFSGSSSFGAVSFETTGPALTSQGWTPLLQTHFGNYTVVPEPGTCTLLGLATLIWLFRGTSKGSQSKK